VTAATGAGSEQVSSALSLRVDISGRIRYIASRRKAA
jgi:hypothetical protein